MCVRELGLNHREPLWCVYIPLSKQDSQWIRQSISRRPLKESRIPSKRQQAGCRCNHVWWACCSQTEELLTGNTGGSVWPHMPPSLSTAWRTFITNMCEQDETAHRAFWTLLIAPPPSLLNHPLSLHLIEFTEIIDTSCFSPLGSWKQLEHHLTFLFKSAW